MDPLQINSTQVVLGVFTCKMKLLSSNFSKSMHLGLRQKNSNQLLFKVLETQYYLNTIWILLGFMAQRKRESWKVGGVMPVPGNLVLTQY